MEPTHTKPFDIEDRLVRFAGEIILFTKTFGNDDAGRYLRDQLTRSSCASALNYGEVQGAETTKDTLHKLGLVLKELKESRVSLKISAYLKMGSVSVRTAHLREIEDLIAIIATVKKNKQKGLID